MGAGGRETCVCVCVCVWERGGSGGGERERAAAADGLALGCVVQPETADGERAAGASFVVVRLTLPPGGGVHIGSGRGERG